MHYLAPEYLLKYGSKRVKYFMEYNELRDYVKKGECETIEFKLKAKHPEKIVREIVAFANTKGGKVILGVDDDGAIQGLKFAMDEEISLINAIDKLISPPIDYEIYQSTLPNGREVLLFDIEESTIKLHYVIDIEHKNQPIAYVRVKDKSIKASKELKAIIKAQNKQSNKSFVFGTKEKALMQYLENNKTISLDQYIAHCHLPPWLASKTLIKLCQSGVLDILPADQYDLFVLKHSQF